LINPPPAGAGRLGFTGLRFRASTCPKGFALVGANSSCGAAHALRKPALRAWGKRRNTDATDAASQIVAQNDRGYTGHEMLDNIGLIHMNGRVYDPTLARFISADPFIQHPDMLASYNRYSYVYNTPLSATDPSGYFLKWLERKVRREFKRSEIFRAVVAIGAAWLIGPAVGDWVMWSLAPTSANAALIGTIAGGAAGGFTGGLIASGGDIKAAGLGALTGGLLAGVSSTISFGGGEAASGAESFASHERLMFADAGGTVSDAGVQLLHRVEVTASSSGWRPTFSGPDVMKDLFSFSAEGGAGAVFGPLIGTVRAYRAAQAAKAAADMPKPQIVDRVRDLHNKLDPIAQNSRTTAMLETSNGTRVAASGGRDLTRAQRAALTSDEVAARMPGAHAEVTALEHASANGLKPLQLNASRPFCAGCTRAIEQAGGQVVSPSHAIWPRGIVGH
jgi:RHS repeat-associated protein